MAKRGPFGERSRVLNGEDSDSRKHLISISIISIALIIVFGIIILDNSAQLSGSATSENGEEVLGAPEGDFKSISETAKLLCRIAITDRLAYDQCLAKEEKRLREELAAEAKPEVFKPFQFWVFQFNFDQNYVDTLNKVLAPEDVAPVGFRVGQGRYPVRVLCIFSSKTTAECRGTPFNVLPENSQDFSYDIWFKARFEEDKSGVPIFGRKSTGVDIIGPNDCQLYVESPQKEFYLASCSGGADTNSFLKKPDPKPGTEAGEPYLTPPTGSDNGRINLQITYTNRDKGIVDNTANLRPSYIVRKEKDESGNPLEFDKKEDIPAKFKPWVDLFERLPERPAVAQTGTYTTVNKGVKQAKSLLDNIADKTGNIGAVLACPGSIIALAVPGTQMLGLAGAGISCINALTKFKNWIKGIFYPTKGAERAAAVQREGEKPSVFVRVAKGIWKFLTGWIAPKETAPTQPPKPGEPVTVEQIPKDLKIPWICRNMPSTGILGGLRNWITGKGWCEEQIQIALAKRQAERDADCLSKVDVDNFIDELGRSGEGILTSEFNQEAKAVACTVLLGKKPYTPFNPSTDTADWIRNRCTGEPVAGKVTYPGRVWEELTPEQHKACFNSWADDSIVRAALARFSPVSGIDEGGRSQAAAGVAAAGGAGAEPRRTETGEVQTPKPTVLVPVQKEDIERGFRPLTTSGNKAALIQINDPTRGESTLLALTVPDGTTYQIVAAPGSNLGGVGISGSPTTFSIPGKGAGGVTGTGGGGLSGGQVGVKSKPEGTDVNARINENGDVEVDVSAQPNAKAGVVTLEVLEDPAKPEQKKEIRFVTVPTDQEFPGPGRTTAERASIVILIVLLLSSAVLAWFYFRSRKEEEHIKVSTETPAEEEIPQVSEYIEEQEY